MQQHAIWIARFVVRTPFVSSTYSMIRYSIASDTLWIRKICHRYAITTLHMPYERDRSDYHVAVAYQAIKLRSYYVHAALHTFLRRTCDVCTATIVGRFFLNMFEKFANPLQASRIRRSRNATATEGFDAVTFMWGSLRIEISRTFAGRFLNV